MAEGAAEGPPIRWSFDPDRRLISATLTGDPTIEAYFVFIRDVATLTNFYGGHGILVDMRELAGMPGYAAVVRLANEVARVRSPSPDFLAFLAAPGGVVYGKARQTVAVMVALDLVAELFTDEAEARRWLDSRRPGAVVR